MAIVTVEKNRYTVDSLYQWDVNQVLKIYGLSLPTTPTVHFTNESMDRAIVKTASMDTAGVITADIPNSLLQKPYKITAYVCIRTGDKFQSLYSIVIPIKARNQPADYTITIDDEEVYSFNALEELVNNTVQELTLKYDEAIDEMSSHPYISYLEGDSVNPVGSDELIKNAMMLFLDRAYPIGSIYMSTNNVNPANLFGGTWKSWGAGRVPVGINSADSDFNTIEKTGGSKTHTLSVNEIPSHTHGLNDHVHDLGNHVHDLNNHTHGLGKHTHDLGNHVHNLGSHTHSVPNHTHTANNAYMYSTASGGLIEAGPDANSYRYFEDLSSGDVITASSGACTTGSATGNTGKALGNTGQASGNTDPVTGNTGKATGNTGKSSGDTTATGSGKAHNNLQPYITCYMWKRVL